MNGQLTAKGISVKTSPVRNP